jgi:hypothetical protein
MGIPSYNFEFELGTKAESAYPRWQVLKKGPEPIASLGAIFHTRY